jgi:transcriptional regulator with XRE-family HTH domain
LARLSGPGIRAFLNLAEAWGLTLEEQRALLGGVGRSTYTRWKRDRDAMLSVDQLERISHLLGIYQSLETLLPTTGRNWPKAPNDGELFGGEPPLRHMIEGGITGLRRVRELLAAERGW